MKNLLIIALFSANQTLCAELWPTKDDCAKAQDNVIKHAIEISKGNFQLIGFEITTKGNGSISLPGVNVRVYDAHDDGLVFENNLLSCEWKDTDDDGFLDLVVSGTAILTSDDEGIDPIKIEVSGIFRWNPDSSQFEMTQCSPEIYTWIKPQAEEAQQDAP